MNIFGGFMKKLLIGLVLLCSTYAQAAPQALPALRGVLIESLSSTLTFEMIPTVMTTCSESVVDFSYVVYGCDAATTLSTMNSTWRDFFVFDHVALVHRKDSTSGYWLDQYTYRGRWSTAERLGMALGTDATLIINVSSENPQDISGYLTIEKYKLTMPFQATPYRGE
jgi:hypothetical protein